MRWSGPRFFWTCLALVTPSKCLPEPACREVVEELHGPAAIAFLQTPDVPLEVFSHTEPATEHPSQSDSRVVRTDPETKGGTPAQKQLWQDLRRLYSRLRSELPASAAVELRTLEAKSLQLLALVHASSQRSHAAAAPVSLASRRMSLDPLAATDDEDGRLEDEDLKAEKQTFRFWGTLTGSIMLVLFAGAMSGLNIAFYSVTRTDLEVVKRSCNKEAVTAANCVEELQSDRHLMLVSLLVCNAAAMEALPVLLDDLMSPVAAVLLSLTAVLLFGEIIPQALCKAASMQALQSSVPFVKVLMFVTWPVSKPLAKLLDFIFGVEDKAYNRGQFQCLLSFQRESGELSSQESAIMEGAMELTRKSAGCCLRAIAQIQSVSIDSKLDVKTADWLLETGRSRIPVHEPGKKNVFKGVLNLSSLVKLCPKDSTPLQDIELSRMLHVTVDTRLFDILELLEGRTTSHMAAVYDAGVDIADMREAPPDGEAIGIVTLEDILAEVMNCNIGAVDLDMHCLPGNTRLHTQTRSALSRASGLTAAPPSQPSQKNQSGVDVMLGAGEDCDADTTDDPMEASA